MAPTNPLGIRYTPGEGLASSKEKSVARARGTPPRLLAELAQQPDNQVTPRRCAQAIQGHASLSGKCNSRAYLASLHPLRDLKPLPASVPCAATSALLLNKKDPKQSDNPHDTQRLPESHMLSPKYLKDRTGLPFGGQGAANQTTTYSHIMNAITLQTLTGNVLLGVQSLPSRSFERQQLVGRGSAL
ncbi:MAG: hypothetical protein M2R45_04752 [Verrucomicrobia subdivision 3 bacterium]|nr:hypothetical protein [Limisphaerales bacterium]MCS1415081.1 hypothetical protein [Limisphaerales bacterium]